MKYIEILQIFGGQDVHLFHVLSPSCNAEPSFAVFSGKAEEERAKEFEMRCVALSHEATEASAHEETLMAARSRELARAQAAEADAAALTARRVQTLFETFAESPWMEQGLTKLRTSLTNVQEQLNQRARSNQHLLLELEEAQAELADVKRTSDNSEATSKELQEEVQQLMLASSAACEIRNAEASLEACREDLAVLAGELRTGQLACQQVLDKKDAQLNEAKTEALLVEELRCTSRQLELKVQRAEAKLHTQERRYKQEREEWHRKLRQMRLSNLSSEVEVDDVNEVQEVQVSSKNQVLAHRKEQLQLANRELELELEVARKKDQQQRQEAEAKHQADQLRKEALLQEIHSARGHVAALAQEIGRLRDAKLETATEKISQVRLEKPARSDPKRKHVERLLAQQEKQESQLTQQIDASKKAEPCSNEDSTCWLKVMF